MKSIKLTYLLSLIILFGCNEDETPGQDLVNGSAKATVSGAVNLSLSGDARFIHSKITTTSSGAVQGSNIGITLEDDDNGDILATLTIVIPEDITGVKTGTYNVNIESSGAETVTLITLATSEYFMSSTSGTITLTEIKDLQVKGSVNATIGSGAGFAENESTISGEFTAVGITQTID